MIREAAWFLPRPQNPSAPVSGFLEAPAPIHPGSRGRHRLTYDIVTAVRLLLTAILTIVATAQAHNGVTNFIPTVPDPTAMSIDGFEEDWDWYDFDFIVTPDRMVSVAGDHVGDGPNPAPDDFSAAYLIAWSPPPDNAIWFFARCTDDTLRVAEGRTKDSWWRDDHMEFGIDSDHSGGEITGASPDDFDNGYRVEIHSQFSTRYGINVAGIDKSDWTQADPFTYLHTEVLPDGAGHLSANVEYSYEVRLNLWDSYDLDGNRTSAMHDFALGRAIHLAVTFWDMDGDNLERRSVWAQEGNQPSHWSNASIMSDVVPVLTADVDGYEAYDPFLDRSAVEHATWGMIKHHLQHRAATSRRKMR